MKIILKRIYWSALEGLLIITECLKEFHRSLDFAIIIEFYCESWVMLVMKFFESLP